MELISFMNDESSSKSPQRSWLERLSHFLHPEPQNRSELLKLLEEAVDHKLIDPDSLDMIEGVIDISEMQVRDIMVPRSHMIVVEINESMEQSVPIIKASGHSRFPVIGETRDEIIGILFAKDLISFPQNNQVEPFNLRELIRPAVFVPESKRLDVLLREFRQNRNHMAIVADEYGGVAGLVTIEDILEEIVGDITDEHDLHPDAYIKKTSNSVFNVKALTPIDDFNEYFECQLSDDEFDTIGGLITNALGHLPKRGETVQLDKFEFKILHADSRRIRLLEVRKIED
jgi:magnesium and cobalt transporter